MRELARGGEPLPTSQTELQLDPPAAFGVIRRPPEEFERPAACDPADEPFDSHR
jgi:hypothetical protein